MSSQSSRSRRLAASASAASARPFHDAIALSSSPGCGRSLRIWSSRARKLGIELAADDRASVLERLEQLRGHALFLRPRVRQSLDAVRVGVLRRRERAVRQQQVAEHVLDRLLDHLAVALAAGDEPRVEVRGDEERVVVEHLLEVRDEPAVVDGVAVEAAPDDVVHAPRGHAVERALDHFRLAPPQQQLEHRVRRELRRPSEAAPLRVERRAQPAHGLADQRLGERLRRRRAAPGAADRLDELAGGARHVRAPLAVRARHRLQHLAKARQAVTRLGREVRAAVERLAVGREERGQRPAAVPGQRHDRVHVDRVEIRALLAVDFDVDEVLVLEPRRLLVLERLVLHHVAPVARCVADGEEDRPVLLPRAGERLLAPRVPVDGVAGVLEEVRARLASQPVHVLPSDAA